MCLCLSLAHSRLILQKKQTKNDELRDMCFWCSLAHWWPVFEENKHKMTNSVTCVFDVRWHIQGPSFKKKKQHMTNSVTYVFDVRWHIQGPLFKKEQTQNDELRDMCFWRPLAHLGLATWTERTKSQAKSTFLGWLVLLEVGSQAVREAVWCWASIWWWGSSLAFIA